MSDTTNPPAEQPAKQRLIPMALRQAAERHAHVVLRLQERGGITWTVEQVEALEKKIKWCRMQLGSGKTPILLFPQKIGTDLVRKTQYWRVLISGASHTFVWSNIARGLISYTGPGEKTNGLNPTP